MTAKFFGNNQNLFLAIARNNFAVAEKHFLGHEKFFVTTKKHFFRTRKIEKVFLRPRKLWLASGLQKIIARILFFLISFRDRKNNISLSQEIIFCVCEKESFETARKFFSISQNLFLRTWNIISPSRKGFCQNDRNSVANLWNGKEKWKSGNSGGIFLQKKGPH